ncbi:hypothetical protein [Clostridium grantii]|uniref:Uncharacterized protein n=1 Tax=Clostridium grantii DSM 8605 TaxID=1121316 RepID=A0A1M5VP46_9CLOT|nr:hypothetical protein [Clostridium grantii]SHH77036.1 hypothetical protein SAMN02745207_02408 [Clostridium grantii DSM 8605]
MEDNNKNIESEIFQEDDKILIDIEEKIKGGEYSTKSILIDSIIEDEELVEDIEELNSEDDYISVFEEELDFENGVIDGFDMKKFNEEFNQGKSDENIRFIEEVEGLSSIIENIDEYEDKVEEFSPGLFVFKTKKDETKN